MASSKDSFGMMNSIILKFLLLPFRWGLILFFVIMIVFGTSIITQGYFNSDEILKQEMIQMNNFERSLNSKGFPDAISHVRSVNYEIAGASYDILKKVFFDWTKINRALLAQDEKDPGYALKNKVLIPHWDKFIQIDKSLKMVSIRIGYIAWFVFFSIIVSFVALIDGFVARAIRQKNAGRESAGLYHRAKYWRSGILWLSIGFYLAFPVAVSPYWLFIPCISVALLIWLQAKYLKKYL